MFQIWSQKDILHVVTECPRLIQHKEMQYFIYAF